MKISTFDKPHTQKKSGRRKYFRRPLPYTTQKGETEEEIMLTPIENDATHKNTSVLKKFEIARKSRHIESIQNFLKFFEIDVSNRFWSFSIEAEPRIRKDDG